MHLSTPALSATVKNATRSNGRRSARLTAAIAATIGMSALGVLAAPASASVVSLASGASGGGMTLNSTNVLAAWASPAAASLTTTTYSIQSVTFDTPLFSSTTVNGNESGLTFSMTASSGTLTTEKSNGLNYATASNTNDATTKLSGNDPDTTAVSQPVDSDSTALRTMAGAAQIADVSGSTPSGRAINIVIGQLTPDTPYTIDFLLTARAFSQRSYTLTDTGNNTVTETSEMWAGQTSPKLNEGIYDANDTVTSDGSGNIKIVLTSDNSPLFVGMAISSAVPAPEPASLGLLAVGSLAFLRRRVRGR